MVSTDRSTQSLLSSFFYSKVSSEYFDNFAKVQKEFDLTFTFSFINVYVKYVCCYGYPPT